MQYGEMERELAQKLGLKTGTENEVSFQPVIQRQGEGHATGDRRQREESTTMPFGGGWIPPKESNVIELAFDARKLPSQPSVDAFRHQKQLHSLFAPGGYLKGSKRPQTAVATSDRSKEVKKCAGNDFSPSPFARQRPGTAGNRQNRSRSTQLW